MHGVRDQIINSGYGQRLELPNIGCAAVIFQELSLAGNDLREVPKDLCKLSKLRKLQLSGNRLKTLPESLCSLSRLEVFLLSHLCPSCSSFVV